MKIEEKENKVVVIPIYKTALSEDEKSSLRQCVSVLGRHEIRMVCPESMDISPYEEIAGRSFQAERFDDVFFEDINGYNQLLKDDAFWKRFANFEYMLIYQLDAWVFSDELDAWCSKGYDYIGAPWFEEHKTHEEGKKLWCVGNGGFSLRRIEAMRRIVSRRFSLIKTPRQVFRDEYRGLLTLPRCLFLCQPFFGTNNIQHLRHGKYPYEDMFFTYHMKGSRFELSVPGVEEAAAFSFERSPKYLFEEVTSGHLPFGCHAWRKYQYQDFWKRYISCSLQTHDA
ncbi:MAG: hypothetical protein IKR91_03535 [Alloprevotella sp.]|nr:hypothetical protein [Alloprevotella sp.]